MKRNFTKLLIISIICAIITFVCCYFSGKYMDYKFFSITEGIVNDVNQMGSDNPGAGWYLLIFGGGSLITEFGIVLLYFIFVIVIPALILSLVILLQVIARLFQIGNEKEWKRTTSKVLTYISMSFQILLGLELLSMIFALNNILLAIALISSIVGVVLFIKELKVMGKQTVEIVKEQ